MTLMQANQLLGPLEGGDLKILTFLAQMALALLVAI
jgi:hypothetical protein